MRSALLETSTGNIIFLSIENVKADFQHADFSKRSLFGKDLEKSKTANTSNIKFSLMACKTSLFLLNKINYFYLH